jgi:hypothetical protein
VPVLTGAKVPGVGMVERVFGGAGGVLVVALVVLGAATGSLLLAMVRRRGRQHA